MEYEQFHDHYIYEGRRYDRISYQLKRLYQGLPDDMQYYFDRGTAVHTACHMYLVGKLTNLDKLHPDIKGMVKAFVKWWEQFDAKLIHSEVFVHSDKYRFAGIPDVRCYKDDTYWVVDLKSGKASKPPKATAIQTAAYREAWREMEPDVAVQGCSRLGVVLRPDETFGPEQYKGSGDFSAFLTLLSAERVARRYT